MKKLLIKILSVFIVALTLPLQAAPAVEKSLYERPGIGVQASWVKE